MVDAQLAELLGSEFAEYHDGLSDTGTLLAVARTGQKPLLEHLKAAGISKMGVRQKMIFGGVRGRQHHSLFRE